jgi:hypothetical protein
MKAEIKTLEDNVNQLEEMLSKKRAENQPQAASTPFSLAVPQSEQVSYTFWFLQRAAWIILLKLFVRACVHVCVRAGATVVSSFTVYLIRCTVMCYVHRTQHGFCIESNISNFFLFLV